MSELNYTFDLTVGDRWDDGHGKWESVKYKANLPLSKISALYAQAAKTHGLDITDQCEEYEDNELSEDFMAAAQKAFANSPESMDFLAGIQSEDGRMDYWSFTEFYLHIARLSDRHLEFERIKADDVDELDIGGYGLFWG